jgi:hypothetical protein
MMHATYQCLHLKLPRSVPGTSTQAPKRRSPFWILTPSALQTASVQPARFEGEISTSRVGQRHGGRPRYGPERHGRQRHLAEKETRMRREDSDHQEETKRENIKKIRGPTDSVLIPHFWLRDVQWLILARFEAVSRRIASVGFVAAAGRPNSNTVQCNTVG